MLSVWELTNVTSQLLLPPGGLLLLGLIGLALLRSHVRIGAGLAFFALASIYTLALPIVSHSLLQALEDPYVEPATDPNAGAIVVLGGGTYAPAPEYAGETVGRYTLERVRYAARLHRRTAAPVLVSGGNPLGLKTSEGEQMKDALHDFGVATKWVEAASNNTFENARRSRETLQQTGIDTIYLVTHAWHMPRAKMVFVNAGLRVIPAPTGYQAERRLRLLDFVPSADALRDSFLFFHEIVGMAWYRLRLAYER